MPKEHVYRRSIVLRSREFDMVRAYAETMGLDFSSALRAIVNEWAMFRAARERAVEAQMRRQAEGGHDAPPLSA